MKRKPMWRIFLERFAFAGVLVFLTYNTFSQFSYWHWAFETSFEGLSHVAGVGKIVLGVLLAILYLVLFTGVYRAKGLIGIFVTLIAIAAILWLLQTAGIIDLRNLETGIVASQIVVIFVLALGSMWSIIWRRVFGQYSVQDTGDENHDHDE